MNLVVSVKSYNGVLAVTSNEIAEKLGVLHKDLLEKIDGYVTKFYEFSSAELSALFYKPSKYKAKNGKTNRNYLVLKNGVAQLISGYNASVPIAFALNVAYIQKFNEMEERLKSPRVENFISPTGDYGDINKSIENMEKYLEQGKTWILTALQSVNNLDQLRREVLINLKMLKNDLKKEPKEIPLTVKDYSKLKGIGFKKVYSYLREHGYIEKDSTKPTEKAIKEGLFTLQDRIVGDLVGFKSRITPKGQKYFAKIFATPQLTLN